MIMGGRIEDVPALVEQVGPNAAADLGPALRQVAEQFRAATRRFKLGIVAAHRPVQRTAPAHGAFCRKILRTTSVPLWRYAQKLAENCRLFSLARRLLQLSRPLGSTPMKGRFEGFSGPRRSVPSSFQASAPSICWSSPLSNISIMMSEPPTNSPFT